MSKKMKEIKKEEGEKKGTRKARVYSFASLPPGSPFTPRKNSAIVAAWQKYACWYMGLK